jgi:hypothetical protein
LRLGAQRLRRGPDRPAHRPAVSAAAGRQCDTREHHHRDARRATQADAGGLLTAVVVDSHTGRGTITLGYRGDTLQGEATRVDAGYAAFGRVHAEVLGGPQRVTTGQRGIANAFGAQGVNAQCEYVLTGPAQGTGVCLFSDGAKYQLHFGS